MRVMLPRDDPGSRRGLALAWLGALSAYPCALLLAVVGQGFGAMLGGCRFIGVTLPVHRQVWALVNEPSLAFAGQPRAGGYWLGSLLLPLLVATVALPLVPRRRSLASELWLVQASWAAAVVAVAWMPLLEPTEGHLGRWLALRGLPPELLWLAPLLAALAATVPLLRLLSLARGARRELPRRRRLALVLLHLGLPLAAWAAVAALPLGRLPTAAAAAAAAPLVVALAIAWYGYPAPEVHELAPSGRGAVLRLTTAALAAVSVLWLAGRPTPDGGAVGAVWTPPGSFDNVRPWIELHPAWPPWALLGNFTDPVAGLHQGADPAPEHYEEAPHHVG